jgi:hypothetical protein
LCSNLAIHAFFLCTIFSLLPLHESMQQQASKQGTWQKNSMSKQGFLSLPLQIEAFALLQKVLISSTFEFFKKHLIFVRVCVHIIVFEMIFCLTILNLFFCMM